MKSYNSGDNVIIALDAMGGDSAPSVVLEGADIIAKSNKNIRFLLYGQEPVLRSLISSFPDLVEQSEIIHAPLVIMPNDKPSSALRNSKESSMRMAIEAVKDGVAHAVVSAGNTGALMAISKVILRTLPNVDRPAIAALVPSLDKSNNMNKTVMLDLGANVECNADTLCQFAVMGDAFAKVLLKISNPRVSLLNVGAEEVKGHDEIRMAYTILKENKNINFCGYIEGDDIQKSVADVVVTDGFTGNISLKTMEGIGKFFAAVFKNAYSSSFLAKIGYLLSRNVLKKAYDKIDPRLYNGAMFLGLNGIVVKSHGSSDKLAYSNAIIVALELVGQNINQKIINELNKHSID